MKAPEKIYLQDSMSTDTIGDLWPEWFDAKVSDNSIEYVRKDAFIEKVCVKLKKLMYDNLMFQGRLHREEVINNFVEDFKKYMKGE
jgi:hypothetical protein